MCLKAGYEKFVLSGKIKNDDAQINVLTKLEHLKEKLEHKFLNKTRFKKIINIPKKNQNIKGIYIYGEVGRGKSMLMDLFFTEIKLQKRKRIHFHSFMTDVHARLHILRSENSRSGNSSDPISLIAKDISKQTNVLCLDEFHVSDIADAMILGRLFRELFKNGITVVTTSNSHPDELYKDGLQRERFIPFISMLKENLEVMSLNATEDYRLAHLKSLDKTYYTPLDNMASKFMEDIFAELTLGAKANSHVIDVLGRKLVISKAHGDIAWMNFQDLCGKPLGASDYIEIARAFGTLLLEGVPQMSKENRNEAKRFITLTDELYEHKVKLIITAEVTPELLYVAGDGRAEFKRTISRLIEMQSGQYIRAAHLSYEDK